MSVITGLIAGSVSLVGLGLDSAIEVASGAAMLWRLHHDVNGALQSFGLDTADPFLMIDAKSAVAIAIQYMKDLMGADFLSEIILEEIELSDDEKTWKVTVSALLPESKEADAPSIATLIAGMKVTPPRRRVYKVFTINAENGNVRSMKIRQPND